MNIKLRFSIIGFIILVVIGIVVFKQIQKPKSNFTENQSGLPKMLELGSTTCVPCKMMLPIVEELKSKYEGKILFEFIDVIENPNEIKKYKINVIPTQIFLNEKNVEFFRHTGFFSKDDILKTFRDNGINLE